MNKHDNLTVKDINDIVGKFLLLKKIRKISPIDIKEVVPEMVFEYNELNDDNEEMTIIEIDWEYAFFEATMYELKKLYDKFISKKKNNAIKK